MTNQLRAERPTVITRLLEVDDNGVVATYIRTLEAALDAAEQRGAAREGWQDELRHLRDSTERLNIQLNHVLIYGPADAVRDKAVRLLVDINALLAKATAEPAPPQAASLQEEGS